MQYYTYKQTGTVTAFVAEFTSASSAITGFQITGNNGADGGGSKAYGKHDSSTWTGLQNGWSSAFKQVYSAGDPSINHLVVADGPIASQSIGSSTDNDLHDLTFSSGVSKVVYVLWAGNSGYHFSDAYFQSVAEALSSACSAAGTLFAVLTGSMHAEQLPYGTSPMPANDAAYFCTDCAGTSDTWKQDFACDGTNVDMTIVYKFASAKTVQAQLTDCADYGCVVDFTVSGDDFTTTSFTSNKWMFTDATVFSGSKVSPDDGIWGAGPGEVNGNGDCYGDSTSPHSGFYGFGNCNGGDGTSTVYYGPAGSQSCSSLKVWVYA